VDDQNKQPATPTLAVAPTPKKAARRGFKYIGENGAALPSVPPRDLSWAETRYYFGDTYAERRRAIEVAYKHLYAWGEPEGDTTEGDE
jgi:hypothetical protein